MSIHIMEKIRNIALAGHAGAGKTTLAETLLHRSGAIHEMGELSRGTTVCDYDEQEKALGHTLEVSMCHFDHEGTSVNLLDTPGFPDFIGRTISVLPAVETVAVVIDARAGIQPVTHRIMAAAQEYGLCRMIIINKIDDPQADLHGLLRRIREVFGNECLPMNLPADNASKVVDCFFDPSEEATDFASVEAARTEIVDQVVEVDEELMELYLEQGQDLSPRQLHDPFDKAMREGHLVPICFVSAETGSGINQLLHTFAYLMPNPMEGNPPEFLKGEGDDAVPVEVTPDADAHAIAHVFRVIVDPFVGKMGVFRVHQGTITPNSQLFVGDARKAFKVGHLFSLQGKDHKEINKAVPGDIAAVAKVEDLHYDAVLHDSHDEDHFHLKPAKRPPPMYGLAVSPTRRGDEQKLSDALHKLAAEDQCLRIEHVASANETVMRGTSELHLRLVIEKMKKRFNVEVATRPPSIPYRETIRGQAEGHHRHKKQTGGAGQFGEVFLKVEALPADSGFEFVVKVVGVAIANQVIPAVENVVRPVMSAGAIAGYGMQDIRVTVYDGKHHPVDSKEVAFVAAGKKAFLDAIQKARPVVLEPIVNLHVVAPSNAVGDITGDLSSRRGRINGNTVLDDNQVAVDGQVPLSELENYESRLKSITAGEGSYRMEFSHYEPVPAQTQKKLAEAFTHRPD